MGLLVQLILKVPPNPMPITPFPFQPCLNLTNQVGELLLGTLT